METKLTFWVSIAVLLILTGCSFPPSLLHQRASTGTPGDEIWIMDDAGKNAKFITKGTVPQWIWGGRTYFAFLRRGKPCDPNWATICGTLYVAEWNGTKQAMIGNPKAITGPDSGENFAWSRDGQWLVFESVRDGNWEIYKIRRDGTGATNLTKNPARDIQPDWTHNGAQNGKIAFVSDRTGNRDIFVMDDNGGNLADLTKDIPDMNNNPDDGDDWRPKWATNADSIAFVGTHRAWGNSTPMIYLTTVSVPGSLAVVSDLTVGGNKLLGWEGSQNIFFASSKGITKYDVKTGKRDVLTAQYAAIGNQHAIGARFLYLGTNNGIKAVEWSFNNKVHDVGPGFNPDR
jgi:hypothetical protein